MTEFSQTEVTVGDGSSGYLVTDYNIWTGTSVAVEDYEDQWIELDWSYYGAPTMINGVLIYTDEARMYNGTLKFSVDGEDCPETNDVGTHAKGGVFNCGLLGSVFRVYCDPSCIPSFAVQEVKLWKETALSATGSAYLFSNNIYSYAGDADKVFKRGSFELGSYEGDFSLAFGSRKTSSSAFSGVSI